MPHRAVFRLDRLSITVKVVCDASRHRAGCLSLNKSLKQEPNLNPDLHKVLLNLRIHNLVLSADALLQISMQPVDRDALRFFWYEHFPTIEGP